MKTVITYGTFDLFHIGHLKLLKRLASLGERLIVGVSTDDFNSIKGKKTVIPFDERIEIIQALECVDIAIPESNWEQKLSDINKYNVDILAMGGDWEGKFDNFSSECKILYLPRTDGISSTQLKQKLRVLDSDHVNNLKDALDIISSIIQRLD